MAKTKLKRMNRFELLELIYEMRKANLDLTQRCEQQEKQIEELKADTERQVEAVRAFYVQQLDDLRMQGSAKELQKRINLIEKQLAAFQRLTGLKTADVEALAAGEEEKPAEEASVPVFTAAPAAEADASAEESETQDQPAGQADASREEADAPREEMEASAPQEPLPSTSDINLWEDEV